MLDSRPSKQHPAEPVDLRAEWAARIEGVGFDPRGVVDDAVGGAPRARSDHGRGAGGDGRPVACRPSPSPSRRGDRTSCSWSWRGRCRPTAYAPPAELVATLERLTERVLDEHCVDLTPAGWVPCASQVVDRRASPYSIVASRPKHRSSRPPSGRRLAAGELIHLLPRLGHQRRAKLLLLTGPTCECVCCVYGPPEYQPSRRSGRACAESPSERFSAGATSRRRGTRSSAADDTTRCVARRARRHPWSTVSRCHGRGPRVVRLGD